MACDTYEKEIGPDWICCSIFPSKTTYDCHVRRVVS